MSASRRAALAGDPVGQDVAQPNPAVLAGLFVGDLVLLEQPDQGRAADAEKVVRLLGGQPLLQRRHGDRLPGFLASTTRTSTS